MGKVAATLLLFSLSFCKADLGDDITQEVNRNLAGLDNLGAKIQHELEPLQNLGNRIQQQVYEGLKPVREMETRMKISRGIDGVTIASYSPGGRQFILRNSVLSECTGPISATTGACAGNIQPLQFTKQEDFCYASINSIINNWYCLTGSGSTSFSMINGVPKCSSSNGSPHLLITIQDFNNMCKNIASSVTYTYFTNTILKDVGPEVQCRQQNGNPRNVCTFKESRINPSFPGFYSQHSEGHINSYNIVY